jgi:hypothetical protein
MAILKPGFLPFPYFIVIFNNGSVKTALSEYDRLCPEFTFTFIPKTEQRHET